MGRAGISSRFLFRATRLVVDTGLHRKSWSREKATDYMVATTGLPARAPSAKSSATAPDRARPAATRSATPPGCGRARKPSGAGRQVRLQAVPRSAARRRHATGDPRTAHQGTQPSVTMADTTDIPGGVVHDLPEDLASALTVIRGRSPPGATYALARNEWICWSIRQETGNPAQARRMGPREPRRRQAAPLLLAGLQASLSAAPNPLSPASRKHPRQRTVDGDEGGEIAVKVQRRGLGGIFDGQRRWPPGQLVFTIGKADDRNLR